MGKKNHPVPQQNNTPAVQRKNLPGKNTTFVGEYHFSGPLPPPAVMREYQDVGILNEILKLAMDAKRTGKPENRLERTGRGAKGSINCGSGQGCKPIFDLSGNYSDGYTCNSSCFGCCYFPFCWLCSVPRQLFDWFHYWCFWYPYPGYPYFATKKKITLRSIPTH